MAIENEPLRLRAHRIENVAEDRWSLVRPDGRRVTLPGVYHQFLKLVAQGMSLSAIAAWQRTHYGASGRFERLARFLAFLHENELLADPRAIELAETLRPDYKWRESIAFPEIFSFELFRIGERRPISESFRWGVAFAFIAMALAVFVQAWPHILRNVGAPESAWPALIAFVLALSLSRSVRALLQMLLISMFSGAGVPLSLRLDLFSFSFSTEEASRVRAGSAYVLASFALLMTVFVPALPIVASLGVPSAIRDLMPFFALVVALSDLSPFRQSALTDCLRAFYVSLDSRHEGRTENTLRALHLTLSALWVLAFGIFLATAGRSFVMQLGPLLRFDQMRFAVPVIALILMLTLLLASFLDDIITALSGNESGERRLWNRRRLLEGSMKEPDRADLEDLPLIRKFDQGTREHLLKNAKVVDVRGGEIVCRQGDRDRTLFIVLGGRFAVARRSSSGRSRNVAVLERGAIFGEVSFFIGEKRTASVSALSEGRLLMIRHDTRLQNLDQGRSAELQLRIWFLQGLVANPLFRELPSEAMDALAFAGERCEFRAGEKIISEGERGESCYFIVQGQASVTQNYKLVNRLKKGDSFGEIALLKPELLRTASITADTALMVIKIDGVRFWNLLSGNLPLAIALERLAEARLRNDARKAKAS